MIYAFGEFEYDTQTAELRRHGEPLDIQDQPLKLLLCFIERTQPDERITNEELLEKVWRRDTPVNTLHSAVRRLRHLLGDNAADERLIKNIRGHGYRFMLPVTTRMDDDATTRAPTSATRQTTARPSEAHVPVFGHVPPVPALVIGRDEALSDLKECLGLTPGEPHIQVLTAVRGWPGVGKTTMAAVLAHDPEMAAAFPDGILWTSLGQTPHLISELAAWGYVLGTDELLRTPALKDATAQLAALLRNKRMLLIVDDVWETEHAVPFQHACGRACALLITTRLLDVAYALAPTPDAVYNLPVLSEEKALELLHILAPTVVDQYPEVSRELVQALEYLPLGLQVAGRLLNVEAHYGWGVTDLLIELQRGARVIAEKAPADLLDFERETIPTVAALLKKSTDVLDDHIRDCFAYLGVYAPKPATFNLLAMQASWQGEDPKPIARVLVNRGLLEPVGDRFQMHALLVSFARSLLES